MSTDQVTAFELRLAVELAKASRPPEEFRAAVRRFKAVSGQYPRELVTPGIDNCATRGIRRHRIDREVELLTPDQLRTIMAALRQLATHRELNPVDAAIAQHFAGKRLLTSREAALGRHIVLHYESLIARQFIEVIEAPTS